MTGHFYIRDSKFPTISSLIKHYQKFPLNKDVNTFLLYPVKLAQPVQQEQEEYVALVPSQPGTERERGREGGRGRREGESERGREGEKKEREWGEERERKRERDGGGGEIKKRDHFYHEI